MLPVRPRRVMKENFAFQLAMHAVQQRDSRYAPQAYAFVCDSLAHTVQLLNRDKADSHHVTGPEMLRGFRDLALQQFGPMAVIVMREWGIRSSEDVGNMVYNLIEAEYFGKNESDKLEDFADGIPLEEFLSKPYQKKSSRQ
ncbi:Minf_1886 family protein [Phragmitibacter flavus]|nr:Minf_1886 family protein [Phragmitibacter flavus]